MPDKTVAILNLSKMGRKYEVRGAETGKDKEGNTTYEVIQILANQKAVEVPEAQAKFLLSTLSTGRARFPDLIDASKFSPASTKDRDAALAENAKLLQQNAELKAKLEASNGAEKSKGGKK